MCLCGNKVVRWMGKPLALDFGLAGASACRNEDLGEEPCTRGFSLRIKAGYTFRSWTLVGTPRTHPKPPRPDSACRWTNVTSQQPIASGPRYSVMMDPLTIVALIRFLS